MGPTHPQPTLSPPARLAVTPRHMTNYAFFALAGGGLVVVSSFLPWIKYKTDLLTFTGWDIGSRIGDNALIVSVFRGGTVPMFGGLATVILGGVAAATAVLLLALARRSEADRRPAQPVVVLACVVGVIVAAAVSVNLISYLHDGYDLGFSIEYGLILLVAAGYFVLLGLTRAVGGPWRWRR
jgi:hypothetical protein